MGEFQYRNKKYDGTYTAWSDAVPFPFSGKWGNLIGETATPAVGFEFKAGDTKVTFQNAYFECNGSPNWEVNPNGNHFTLTPGDETVYTLARLAAPFPFTDVVYVFVDIVAGADEECQSNDDCPKGEKCVEGECVPCEKTVDGAGTLTLYYNDAFNGQQADATSVNLGSGTITWQSEVAQGIVLYAGVLVVPNGFNGNLLIQGFYGPLGASFWQKEVYSGSVPSGTQKVEFVFDASELPIGSFLSISLP